MATLATKRATLAIILILLCYYYVTFWHRNGPSSKLENIGENWEFTSFENSLAKTDREFWDSIKQNFKCPEKHLSRVGNPNDGGKWTCGLTNLGKFSINNPDYNCLVYSFGVNKDSSFEAQVLSNTRCSVFAYDPTVNKIAQPLNSSNPRVTFKKLGIGGKNEGNLKTLKTFMAENGGHNWIDILKVDVEGAEFPSLKNIFEEFEELPFGQLLIELHGTLSNSAGKEKIINMIKKLEEKELRMFYKEVNQHHPECCSEFSFINTNSLHKFMNVEEIKIENNHNLLLNRQHRY